MPLLKQRSVLRGRADVFNEEVLTVRLIWWGVSPLMVIIIGYKSQERNQEEQSAGIYTPPFLGRFNSSSAFIWMAACLCDGALSTKTQQNESRNSAVIKRWSSSRTSFKGDDVQKMLKSYLLRGKQGGP